MPTALPVGFSRRTVGPMSHQTQVWLISAILIPRGTLDGRDRPGRPGPP
jgi:hypothetical protein